MNIGKAFGYMFDDEQWVQKLAIGGLLLLLSIIPLVNIFTLLVVAGYGLRVLRNVAARREPALPNWDDWGGDFISGLYIAVALLIYSLPGIVVSAFSGGINTAIQNASSADDARSILALCTGGLSCISGLWSLAVSIVFPAALIMFAEECEFGSFFRFGRIFRFIGDNLGNYVVALLLILVAEIISALGVILCVIGVFFTSFWSTLVTAHLLGQVKAAASPTPPTIVTPSPDVSSPGDLTSPGNL
ncbi:MAG: DUF4013 domain-containing protein [Anaerolineae bacterium]